MQVQVGAEFSICAKFKNNGNNNVNKGFLEEDHSVFVSSTPASVPAGTSADG